MHSHDRTLLAKLGFQDKDKGDPRHDLACQYLKQPEVAERLVGMMYPDELKLGTLLSSQKFANVDELISLLMANGRNELIDKHKCSSVNNINKAVHFYRHTILKSQVEEHITKGEGQYATTIGFADLTFAWQSHRIRFNYHESIRVKGTKRSARNWGDNPVFVAELNEWVDEFDVELSQFNSWVNRNDMTFQHYISSVDFSFRNEDVVHGSLVEVKISPVPVGDAIRQINLYRQYLKYAAGYQRRKRVALACAFPLLPYEIKALRDESIVYIPLGKNFERWCEEQTRGATSTATLDI